MLKNNMEVKMGRLNHYKIKIIMMLTMLMISLFLSAEIFTGSSITFPATYLASAQWGDYDNDGDQDLLYSGYPQPDSREGMAKLFKNLGNNAFSEVENIFLPAGAATVNFVDVNNDGRLDVFIAGQYQSNDYRSSLYINNGNDQFTLLPFDFTGVTTGSSDWADYDQDGYVDLLLTGQARINDEAVYVTQIYKNNAGTGFSLLTNEFPGVSNSSASWCDYDNDGDQDFALTGTFNTGVYYTKLYKNNDNNNFSEVTGNFIGVRYSRVRWADFDSDGDQDLIITGSNNNNTPSFLKIYKNEGNDNFDPVIIRS